MLHVPPVERAELREDFERCRVGGKLVVGIVKVRFVASSSSILHRRRFGGGLHPQPAGRPRRGSRVRSRVPLAENEADSTRERSCPFLMPDGFGLGTDRPGGRGFESGRPRGSCRGRPRLPGSWWVNITNLQAIVRHMAGEVFVNLHHGERRKSSPSPRTAISARASTGPVWERSCASCLSYQARKKVAELVIIDRVGVRRVRNPEVAGFANDHARRIQ